MESEVDWKSLVAKMIYLLFFVYMYVYTGLIYPPCLLTLIIFIFWTANKNSGADININNAINKNFSILFSFRL